MEYEEFIKALGIDEIFDSENRFYDLEFERKSLTEKEKKLDDKIRKMYSEEYKDLPIHKLHIMSQMGSILESWTRICWSMGISPGMAMKEHITNHKLGKGKK